jgi:hypothetical protein
LRAALAHRYSFDGTGVTTLPDSVGGSDGHFWNGLLNAQGFVRLLGDDQYVSLPNGLLSSGNDKTIESWLTWRGGPAGQPIFDFGSSSAGELEQGSGVSYLSLAATSNAGVMAVAYSRNGVAGEIRLTGTQALPIDTPTHVAVVIESGRNALSLYVNGALNATTILTERLAGIEDVNLWIGRSQFQVNPSLDADVTEFRIYDRALHADQLALSYQLGPDDPLTSTP